MHVEERGRLFQIQRVHDGVASRMNGRLVQVQAEGVVRAQDIESAQGVGPPRARRLFEASVVNLSARAHIYTRDVASAAVAVA